MKVIFLGTGDFSVNVLDSIIKSNHKVVCVVCQPDKPSGRGHKFKEPPVKIFAKEHNLPVYQFNKIRLDGVETLKHIDADIMVTASYGQILSQEIIDLKKYGILNVHASLLPKLRGATPIQQAIMEGFDTTGVTIMKTEAGIDTGDMLLSQSVKIDNDDTFETLSNKLSVIGGGLICKALGLVEDGSATFLPQNHNEATFTKMLKKEDCLIDFNKTSKQISCLVRALNPDPIAYFNIDNMGFKVYSVASKECDENIKNGSVIKADSKEGLIIKCIGGAVEILEFTPPAGKRMTAKSYLNGKKIEIGKVLNE